MQHLLKPLVVSWGYESLMPSNSRFIDHHEWWGTRDPAAFLSVPAAIEFQEKYNWDKVRDDCHVLAREAQQRICDLTRLAPLHSDADGWFRQMFTASLKADTDIVTLKERLYNEYRIEVPLICPFAEKKFKSQILFTTIYRGVRLESAISGGRPLVQPKLRARILKLVAIFRIVQRNLKQKPVFSGEIRDFKKISANRQID